MLVPSARRTAPKALCSAWRYALITSPSRPHSLAHRCASSFTPRIADRNLWYSIVPRVIREWRPWRRSNRVKSSEWNPATFYIFIFLIIGSNSMNTIALRNEASGFSEKTKAKIADLKEAIDRVHKGETVNLKRLLGTDDEEREAEWEEAMREIEAAITSNSARKQEVKPTENIESGKEKSEMDKLAVQDELQYPRDKNGVRLPLHGFF